MYVELMFSFGLGLFIGYNFKPELMWFVDPVDPELDVLDHLDRSEMDKLD